MAAVEFRAVVAAQVVGQKTSSLKDPCYNPTIKAEIFSTFLLIS